MTVYYVRNKKTREVLNQQGTWSRDFGSYRLAEFATEAEAIAAFSAGVECVSVKRDRKGGEK
jgi:hypothetical protein